MKLAVVSAVLAILLNLEVSFATSPPTNGASLCSQNVCRRSPTFFLRGGGDEDWEEYDLELEGIQQEEDESEEVVPEEAIPIEEENEKPPNEGDDEEPDDEEQVDESGDEPEGEDDTALEASDEVESRDDIDHTDFVDEGEDMEDIEETNDEVFSMEKDRVVKVEDVESWEALNGPVDEGEEEPQFVAANTAGDHFFSTDDDSSAFVDREELADAYDEGESVLGTVRAEDSDDDDRVSIDDVPPPINDELLKGNKDVVEQPQEGATQQLLESSELEGEPIRTIPKFVDKDTEQILVRQCKYKRAEVKAMKPEIAAFVAHKRLRRPLEGMPPNWIKEDTAPLHQSRSLIRIIKHIPKAIIPISIGALAIYGSIDVGNIAGILRSVKMKVKPPSGPDAPLDEEVEEELVPDGEHLNEVIPESLKPGENPKAPKDQTKLDKIITSVEKGIKAFLQIEI